MMVCTLQILWPLLRQELQCMLHLLYCHWHSLLLNVSSKFFLLIFLCIRALSEVPNTEPVAGVRVGLIGDRFVVNPTTKEMEDSKLDLMLAGTGSAILMIEVDSQTCCSNAGATIKHIYIHIINMRYIFKIFFG